MLTLQTWGGWGDVLREISLLPVDAVHAKLGVTTRMLYRPAARGEFHAEAGCPELEKLEALVGRLRSVVWGGVGMPPAYAKALARGARGLIQAFAPETGLFEPNFDWKPEDDLPASFRGGCKNWVLQTHLTGLPSKRWEPKNWSEVIRGIQNRFPDVQVHVLDPSGQELATASVVVHDQLTMAQAIRMVSQADRLISVDSWSKYVAAWSRIPQLIVVPDQTPDYPQLTANAVWRYSFRGLHAGKEICLLGLKPRNTSCADYSFGSMENLVPTEMMEAISKMDFP